MVRVRVKFKTIQQRKAPDGMKNLLHFLLKEDDFEEIEEVAHEGCEFIQRKKIAHLL